MTHTEIDAMPSGPELDELACRALGWVIETAYAAFRICEGISTKEWPTFRFGVDKHEAEQWVSWKVEREGGSYEVREVRDVPPVSRDGATALRAATARQGCKVEIEMIGSERIRVRFSGPGWFTSWESADTAPLAIARAIAKTAKEE